MRKILTLLLLAVAVQGAHASNGSAEPLNDDAAVTQTSGKPVEAPGNYGFPTVVTVAPAKVTTSSGVCGPSRDLYGAEAAQILDRIHSDESGDITDQGES